MEKLVPKLGLSKATLHRRKASGRLDPAESNRVVRFARLMGKAIEVLESDDDARQWLTSPQFGLGGAIPLDYADTEAGAREVEDLLIETEGKPEEKRVEVVGTSSEFSVDTFGKPKTVVIDPGNRVLRYSNEMRVAVAIRRGEQFAELSEFGDALKEYQKALETTRNSSLANYRIAEVFFLQQNWQAAANSFREALNGDLEPKWTEVWAHINLGKIFDVTGQRERAVNEYNLAIRTKDNTQGAQEEAAKFLKTPYERQRRPEQ